MSSEFEEPLPLDPIESVLAGFTPAPPQLDRDRLMYLAGQASACSPLVSRADILSRPGRTAQGTRRWLWPASTAALAATSLSLAVALFVRPTPQSQIVYRDRPVFIEAPASVSPAANERSFDRQPVPPAARLAKSPLDGGYLNTRRVALRIGVDGLGTPSSGSEAASPATYLDLLKTLAGAPAAGPADSPVVPSPTM